MSKQNGRLKGTEIAWHEKMVQQVRKERNLVNVLISIFISIRIIVIVRMVAEDSNLAVKETSDDDRYKAECSRKHVLEKVC